MPESPPALGVALSPHEEAEFTGREYKLRASLCLRGRSVYVVQSLFGDGVGSANDRLCQLLFFINALKDGGASSVAACVPYLAYARQDRRIAPRDPLTSRYVAQLFEAVEVDRVVASDVHNLAAFENAFRCPTRAYRGGRPLRRAFRREFRGRRLCGGVARHRRRQTRPPRSRASRDLHSGRTVTFALMDKVRSAEGVSGTVFAGDVAGRRVIVVDDLISSGTTVLRAMKPAAARVRPASRWRRRMRPSQPRRSDCSSPMDRTRWSSPTR